MVVWVGIIGCSHVHYEYHRFEIRVVVQVGCVVWVVELILGYLDDAAGYDCEGNDYGCVEDEVHEDVFVG